MRRILVCVVFVLVCCVVHAQHTGQYKIGGKIEGMDSGRVVMKRKRWRGIRVRLFGHPKGAFRV